MSIYQKPVDQIVTADLDELLTESAAENIRLEFKLQDLTKDEALKKLTSFANTFGGYMIIGAKGDADGKLLGLPGVDPISGFKQRMVSWGYDGAYPPLLLFTSDAVPSPQDHKRVCYVVYAPESAEAPHFINARKGVYVRTDEFSKKFEAQLATFQEIQHLANRRAISVARRDGLIERATARFLAQTASAPPNLTLAICPLFPSNPLLEHAAIEPILASSEVPWRSFQFPKYSKPISQHESMIILKTAYDDHSLLEVNIWGLLFYAYNIFQEIDWPQTPPISGIHLYSLVGRVLVSLEHARRMYERMAFDGSLLMRARLDRIRGVSLISSSGLGIAQDPASPLDDRVQFDIVTNSAVLKAQRDVLATDMIRSLMFALNRADLAADDQAVRDLLLAAYKYNSWRAPKA